MSVLGRLTKQIFETDQGLQDYRKFVQMRDHDGFKSYLSKYLQLYVGLMLEDMLSDRYTKLSAGEKDIQQRAYFEVHKLIGWIMQPELEAQKLNLIRAHNKKMEGEQDGRKG